MLHFSPFPISRKTLSLLACHVCSAGHRVLENLESIYALLLSVAMVTLFVFVHLFLPWRNSWTSVTGAFALPVSSALLLQPAHTQGCSLLSGWEGIRKGLPGRRLASGGSVWGFSDDRGLPSSVPLLPTWQPCASGSCSSLNPSPGTFRTCLGCQVPLLLQPWHPPERRSSFPPRKPVRFISPIAVFTSVGRAGKSQLVSDKHSWNTLFSAMAADWKDGGHWVIAVSNDTAHASWSSWIVPGPWYLRNLK